MSTSCQGKRERESRRQQERWIKRDEDRAQGATTPWIETYPTLPRSPWAQQGLDMALALAQKSRGKGRQTLRGMVARKRAVRGWHATSVSANLHT